MSKILNEKILKVEEVAVNTFRMTIASEYTALHAKPGQFVNIRCSDDSAAMLRRPISICDVNREEKTFIIVFQVRGKGTEQLASKKTGQMIDFIGPLGKPFAVDEKYKRIAVVGGGIGIFPLLFLMKEMRQSQIYTFLGFRSKENIALQNEFKNACGHLYLSTDDGSEGYRGVVVDVLEKEMETTSFDIVYTCGPMPMIRRVVKAAENSSTPCQVSLEQRMGCGIGACLVCACKTKTEQDWDYGHVCKDGPVFWSHEVILDE